jgi:hypothetical protein
MNKLTRLYAVGLTVAVLVALALGFAAGQEAGVIGQFTPFVIDLTQEVPVQVDAPVVLESGETVTVMTPLTIGVELRIRVDGPQQTMVEVLDATEPEIAVAEAAPEQDAAVQDDELTAPKGNGFYTVGVEIAPGIWESTGTDSFCYWEVLDKNQNFIKNHFGEAGGSVTITTDAYEVHFQDCGTWEYRGPLE